MCSSVSRTDAISWPRARRRRCCFHQSCFSDAVYWSSLTGLMMWGLTISSEKSNISAAARGVVGISWKSI